MNIASTIGHNSAAMNPFEAVTSRISDLYEEATNWCDGEELSSQEQADAVSKLMSDIREALKAADTLRKNEKRPLDEQVKAIQAKYKPHLEKAERGLDACKDTLAPWMRRQEDERRAAAEKARQEAEAKRAAALEAMRASKGDLAAREEAEVQVAEAKKADADAAKLEKARTQAKGGARAATLRRRLVAVVVDEQKFARHVWECHRDELSSFLAALAQKRVNAGELAIPGVDIREEETVV